MTVLATRPTVAATRPATCGYDWCDAKRDGVPHDDHIGTSSDTKHLHGREFYQDFAPTDRVADYVTAWVSRRGDLPATFVLNLAHDWSASAAAMTREQAGEFARCVLFWLACMDGVSVEVSDMVATAAMDRFNQVTQAAAS